MIVVKEKKWNSFFLKKSNPKVLTSAFQKNIYTTFVVIHEMAGSQSHDHTNGFKR